MGGELVLLPIPVSLRLSQEQYLIYRGEISMKVLTRSHTQGRFLLGFGIAIAASAGPTYIVEVAHPASHGFITALYNTFWWAYHPLEITGCTSLISEGSLEQLFQAPLSVALCDILVEQHGFSLLGCNLCARLLLWCSFGFYQNPQDGSTFMVDGRKPKESWSHFMEKAIRIAYGLNCNLTTSRNASRVMVPTNVGMIIGVGAFGPPIPSYIRFLALQDMFKELKGIRICKR